MCVRESEDREESTYSASVCVLEMVSVCVCVCCFYFPELVIKGCINWLSVKIFNK